LTIDLVFCTSCGEHKNVDDFAVRSKVTGKLAGWCRDCQKRYRNGHYKKNSEKYKQQAKDWNTNNPTKRKRSANKSARLISKEQKRLAVEYKGGCCVDCGGKYPLPVYDFHHLDPTTKDSSIAVLLNRWGFEAAKEELDKCVLLCANCHRVRHFGE
jgi:hypothetical protein